MGGKKDPPPPTGFSPDTSTSLGIRPQNFLTFKFNFFYSTVKYQVRA